MAEGCHGTCHDGNGTGNANGTYNGTINGNVNGNGLLREPLEEERDIVRKLSFSSANSTVRLSVLSTASCSSTAAAGGGGAGGGGGCSVDGAAEAPAVADPVEELEEEGGQVEEPNEKVQVVVRLRPISPNATASTVGSTSRTRDSNKQPAPPVECFQVVSSSQLLVRAPTGSVAYRTTGSASCFQFSHVFKEETSQRQLFEATTCRVLHRALHHHENGLVFAYGVTNSGKTHTITGDLNCQQQEGILPRAIRFLLDQQRDMPSSSAFSLQVSYLEVYNEKVYDLLASSHNNNHHSVNAPRPVLKLQEKDGTVFIKQLTRKPINNQQQATQWLRIGQQNKQIAETRCNHASSRSHCVFTIYVYEDHPVNTQHNNKNCLDKPLRSKVSIVDLAGSERAAKSGANGLRLQESSQINKSLMNLMHCLENMRWNQQHAQSLTKRMVPFRQSQLTRLFQESFVAPPAGSSSTGIDNKQANVVMIVAIEPCARNFDETLRTLQFSAIAKELIPMNPHMMTRRSQNQFQQARRINSQIASNYDLNGRVKRRRISGNSANHPPVKAANTRAGSRRPSQVAPLPPRRSQSRSSGGHVESEESALAQVLADLRQQLEELQHQVTTLQETNRQLIQDKDKLTQQQIDLISQQNETVRQEKLDLEIRIRQEVVAEMTFQTTQVRNQCTRKLELQQTQFQQELERQQASAQVEIDRLRQQLRECDEEMQRRQRSFDNELAALSQQRESRKQLDEPQEHDHDLLVSSRKRTRRQTTGSKLKDAEPQTNQAEPFAKDRIDSEKENEQTPSQTQNQLHRHRPSASQSQLRRSSRRLAVL